MLLPINSNAPLVDGDPGVPGEYSFPRVLGSFKISTEERPIKEIGEE